MARSELGLALPRGFALAEVPVGDDRHAAGRLAAQRALAELGITGQRAALAYDGTRPIVDGEDVAISITHGRVRALAVAARVRYLGIDLCDDDRRLPELAARYFATEHAFATTPRQLAMCLAAKEAGLKALGLGLLDGGVFDDCVVRVMSLSPPRFAPLHVPLELVIGAAPEGAVALAFSLA